MSLFIKICGVRTPDDAMGAAATGADAIGVNFWPRSRRYVAPDAARDILRAVADAVQRVAVFVDASRDALVSALEMGFDLVQLHGDESPALARDPALHGRCIRAHRILSSETVSEASLAPWDGAGPFHLFDAATPAYGGAGVAFDWSLACSAAARRRVVLAGGLTPDNVADAIRTVRPFGVDVASGVERIPGSKDPDLVARFIAAARVAGGERAA